MNPDSWTCDKCGSDDVMQEYGFYRHMNEEEEDWYESTSCASERDFYWCNACEEDCSPIRADINNLTPHYVEE